MIFLYTVLLTIVPTILAKTSNNHWFSVNWAEELVDPNLLTKEFQDNILNNRLNAESPFNDYLLMTSSKREKYVCKIPSPSTTEQKDSKSQDNPYYLLLPIFKQPCTYRLEHFWNYELCHGRSLKQFHEDIPLAGKRSLEFYLGTYDIIRYKQKLLEFDKQMEDPNFELKLPKIKLDKFPEAVPYLEINMTDGTQCDVTNQPRSTVVRYICNPNGRHEINTIRELSICEYEIVSHSPLLCLHPYFRREDVKSQEINCFAIEGAPTKPKKLLELEDAFKKEELKNLNPTNDPIVNIEPEDPKLIRDFLSGEHCLQGGNGWWKYEFCYGRKVEQFHEEGGRKVSKILLGTWDKQKHVDWIEAHPYKRIRSVPPRYVNHFYSNGDICDETKQPRTVEVRLKCKENKGHPSAVTLYLDEPKICEYTLGVESPIICELIDRVDQFGIFTTK